MIETKESNTLHASLSYGDVKAVSPALEHYTKGALLDGLWKRPEMSSCVLLRMGKCYVRRCRGEGRFS